jgi:hypothetical protein
MTPITGDLIPVVFEFPGEYVGTVRKRHLRIVADHGYVSKPQVGRFASAGNA